MLITLLYALFMVVATVMLFLRKRERLTSRRVKFSQLASSSLGHEVGNKLMVVLGYRDMLDRHLDQGEQQSGSVTFSQKDYEALRQVSGALGRAGQEATKEVDHFTTLIREEVLPLHDMELCSLQELLKESLASLPRRVPPRSGRRKC